MKLIQLNVWCGKLERQIEDLLVSEQADILCLQEVIEGPGNLGFFISLSQLKKVAGYKNVFSSPVFSIKLLNIQASFGNAILSKLPLRSKNTIFTNLEFKKNFNFDTHDYNVRNLQHAVVSIGKHKLNVLNHHGHHVRQHKNGDEYTFKQMKMIADYVDGLSGPIILCGDFNLAPHSKSLELINKRLTNLSVKYKLKTTRTKLTHKTEVCDYIFVNDEVKVKNFKLSKEIVSDHKALILEFDL